jgi:hypothetical protein
VSDFQNYRAVSLSRIRVLEAGETFTVPDSGQIATGPDEVVHQTGADHYEVVQRTWFVNNYETNAVPQDQDKQAPMRFPEPIHGLPPPELPPPPHLTAINPNLGRVGDVITLTGSGLTGIAPDGVDVGGTPSTDAAARTDAEVTFSIPPRAPGGIYVYATVNGQTSFEGMTLMVNP